MRKYYLYALIDPNVKIPKYIGISNDARRRFNEHLEDISNTPKVNWIKSLKKGGQLPILKILKETEDVKQVCSWEKQAISKYHEQWGLTNATKGGEYYAIGTPIDVFDMSGNYLNSYDSMIEYCELNNLNENVVRSISAVCLRKRNYTHDRIFRYSGDIVTDEDLLRLNISYGHTTPRSLYVMDLEGNVLGQFESARKAEKAGFGKESQILSCLNHPETYCSVNGNLICETIEDYPKLIENYLLHVNDHGGWITQYSLEGKYINRFPTMSAAIASLGKTSLTALKECLTRNTSTYKAYNFMWRYSMSKEDVEPYQRSKPNKICKKVQQFTLEGEFIKEYNSTKEAGEILGVRSANIAAAANGQKKSSSGYMEICLSAVL